MSTTTDVLEQINNSTNKGGRPNRFSKKNFTALMTAMLNDPNFTVKVAKSKKGELEEIEEVMVSKGFREFCRRVAEKSGVDKNESAHVLDTIHFTQKDLEGLYEFFAAAVFEYMAAGNRFEFLPRADFTGSISLETVPGTVTKKEAFSPKDRTSLGTYETTKESHRVLRAKSNCPGWLKHRKKV